MYCKIDYFVPLFACLFNYLSANSLSAEKATEDVICNTNYGKLKGFVAENLVDGLITKANVFLGIPFAKPPIAELRFEKPIAPNKWKDIQNASAFSPACFPHHSKEFRNGQASSHSEDCLYLNVIAPHSKSPEPNGYPVLVFIHGGAFAIGSAVEFGWESFADLFVSQDLVVVTIQYRLGPLGFAASGDESFPGNLGLWDARMAMKYVNENIHHFGGDPKRVTAWGHSAGSAIVDGLSLSTHSQDLFAQSIQMSGAVFGEWTTSNRVIQESDKLAAALNCDKHLADSKLLKKCLRGKSVHEILDGVDKIIPGRRDVNMIKFGPRLDADFFTNDYPQLIESAKKKTTLMGATESEAITFTLFGALTDNIMNYLGVSLEKMAIFSKPDFDNFLVEVIATETVFGAKAKQVQDRISAFYLRNPDKRAEDNQFYLEKYTEMISDITFFVPTLMEARYKTAAGWPVFLYFIDYFNSNKYPEQIPVKGSYHAVEYPYLLPENPYFPTFEFDQEDKNFQKHLLDSFISFTKTGQPSVGSTKWPALSDTAPLTYALLNGDEEVKVLKALASEKLKFWQNLRKDFDFDIVRGFHKKTLKSRDEL